MNVNISRAQLRAAGIVAAALAGGGLLWFAVARRAQLGAGTPGWGDGGQPPDGVASELTTLNAAQSWAANRCRPMSAGCSMNTAGTRLRRTYPATVGDDPGDVVRANLTFYAGGGTC